LASTKRRNGRGTNVKKVFKAGSVSDGEKLTRRKNDSRRKTHLGGKGEKSRVREVLSVHWKEKKETHRTPGRRSSQRKGKESQEKDGEKGQKGTARFRGPPKKIAEERALGKSEKKKKTPSSGTEGRRG